MLYVLVKRSLNISDFKALSSHELFDSLLTINKLFPDNACYLVGGAVRDALLGRTISDYDIEIFGINLEKIESVIGKYFKFKITGKNYCVLKLSEINIDISVPRIEIKIGDHHKDFKVSYIQNATVELASARRDFTINSIYFDIKNNTLVDHFNGINDLENKILRHTSNKFAEDPLRVLRGMQFASRFELTALQETADLCSTLTPNNISPERIFEEIKKFILKSTKPSYGLQFLKKCGWTKFFPEIHNLIGCEQDKYFHPEGDVFSHTCMVLDQFAKTKINDEFEDLIVGLACLCHDFGKATTFTCDLPNSTHPEHSVPLSINFLKKIHTPHNVISDVIKLVKYHMLPRTFTKEHTTDSKVLHLAAECENIERLVRLSKNDALGRKNWESTYETSAEDNLYAEAKKLGILKTKPLPILRGQDLIELGLSPSENFTQILTKLYQAQLDCKFSNKCIGISYLKQNLL